MFSLQKLPGGGDEEAGCPERQSADEAEGRQGPAPHARPQGGPASHPAASRANIRQILDGKSLLAAVVCTTMKLCV